MPPCRQHQETLFLDVHGELGPAERQIWEQHLRSCPACRAERKRLADLLQTCRTQLTHAAPTPRQSQSLVQAILSDFRQPGTARQKRRWRPLWVIPAMAAACLLVVLAGWFGLQDFRGLSSPTVVTRTPIEEQQIIENLNVIENLELLEEMEAIEKLVRRVDASDESDLSIRQEKYRQRTNRHVDVLV